MSAVGAGTVPRPSPQTFLVRRLTALGILLVGLLLLVTLVKAVLGGGGGDVAEAPKQATAAKVPEVEARPVTVLDRLVAADRTLAPGATGAPVRGLQQALTVLGHSPGPVDGVYSGGTQTAVTAFQTAAQLPATGSVDAATATALRRALTLWAAERTETVRTALVDAHERGRLDEDAVGNAGAIAMEATLQLARLDAGRAAVLTGVIDQVAGQADVYDGPRTTALFGMLDVNATELARAPVPDAGTDVGGPDGTVYRFIADRGYQFHPLANFARLNRDVAREELGHARKLLAALQARAVKTADGGLVWEYYFPFGGPDRWTSALAQAAGAQAFMRAAKALGSDAAAEDAKGAYDAIPEVLSRPLAGGEWVREYSWSDIAILNAQLQSLVSITEYARGAHDEDAEAYTKELSTAARALLPQLDTGSWSDYSVGGSEASQHYHCYHVDLLGKLVREDPDNAATWRTYRRRWQGYADARGGCPEEA